MENDCGGEERDESIAKPGINCSTKKKSWRRVFVKLSNDRKYKDKWIYTLCILASAGTLGWVKSLFGPSFLDLIMISDTSLVDGSWIVTTFYIGYVMGSVIGGIMYKMINPNLQFALALVVIGAAHVFIPWCVLFGIMLFGHLVKGIGAGLLDVVITAEIFRIWLVKGSTFYVTACLAYSIGSVISPLVAAPFLMENNTSMNIALENKSLLINTSSNLSALYMYDVTNTTSLLLLPLTNASPNNSTNAVTESEVYLPYLGTAFICFLNALLFAVSFFKIPQKRDEDVEKRETKSNNVRDLPLHLKLIAFGLFGFALMLFSAIDEGYVSYLSAFCVEYFSWTKAEGAFITSLVFICVMISRIVFVVVMKFFNIVVLLLSLTLILFLDLLALLLVSLYYLDTCVWISSAIFGFFKAVLFALILSWTNEYFFPVSGVVSSYAMVVAMTGNAVTPLFIGFLMNVVGYIAFAYVFVAETALLFVTACVGALFTNYVVRNYGVTYNSTQEIDVNETETLTPDISVKG